MTVDFAVFDRPRPSIDPARAAQIALDHYGISGTAEPLAGERDRSFKITGGSGEYVLKVGNLADQPDALEGQGAAIEWARDGDRRLPLAEVIRTKSGGLSGSRDGHHLQMTRFVAGARPPEHGTPALRRSLGQIAGRLAATLRGFDHPVLHRTFPWTLIQLPGLAPLLAHVDGGRRGLITLTLRRFEEEVVPVLKRLPHQAIHGDINPDNFVVDPSEPDRVVGLFDFGDMSWSPRVIEVAIAATYQCFGTDPAAATAQVVSAFHAVEPLQDAEIQIIPDLVSARCAQSLLMAARSVDNVAYATADAELMWALLVALEEAGRERMAVRIAAACGVRTRDPRPFAAAAALRKRRLAPALQLGYDEPVHLRRGEGMWLFDNDGRRLLDAYNNVPHVGHAHPEVVSALASQSRRLAINTRYLVDGVAEYADRLVGSMPDPLSVVWFVNSGSEATDLAYRIARTVTGRRGVITTANAYHGVTTATAAMSPEEYGDLEPWAARIRGAELLGAPAAAGELRSDLEAARHRLAPEEPAMLILDTVFSSDGIFELPSGYLETARMWADARGALLVADEVQAGFGRVGTGFWGFASSGAVPDVVTLGKPMGNGYPMGAVVTSPAVAAEFASRSHFFSTFAGSPVAAAVGAAVLDVIESEDLAANAATVGAYLKGRILDLDHPDVVDVRGPGLFVGVELRSSEHARRTVNEMRRRGVLIGSTGPRSQVLKIRPPLVCATHHADRIADTLGASLRADRAAGH